jgi:dienelactone hydrolase
MPWRWRWVQHLDRLSIRPRATLVGAIVVVLCGVQWAWPAVDAYARAATLMSDAVFRLPVRPVAWVTPAPVSEDFRWAGGGYGVLTRPNESGEHPALILMLGAEPAGPDDPRVRRLTDSLARIGFVVLLGRSDPLIDGEVTPSEVPLLVGAFRALRQDPRVDSEHVAFVGLSVGGSIEMVAAADPRIAGNVWFVLALGPYFDAGTLTAEVLSGFYRIPGDVVSWEPDETAVRVVTNTLLSLLSDPERAALLAGADPATPEGRAAAALLGAPSLQRAEEVIGELPPAARAALDEVSPGAHLHSLRAPLYLLHDRWDQFIPWPQSDAIAAAYEPAVYHRLDIFEHADPEIGNLGVMVGDGWRLLRLFAAIIESSR